MVKSKTKPLLASSREKKRYLAYEVISNHKFNDAMEINKAIFDNAKDFVGNLGMAKMGLIGMNDKWNERMQRGIIRVNNKHVENLKSSFIFINNIKENDVIVRSIGASGILKKAQKKYLS